MTLYVITLTTFQCSKSGNHWRTLDTSRSVKHFSTFENVKIMTKERRKRWQNQILQKYKIPVTIDRIRRQISTKSDFW